jgi:hydrogenase small subunit
VEDLILDVISLDYHHTLQAAAGHQAEAAREQAMKENHGEYILIVDGSLPGPDVNPGYSTIAGISNYQMLMEAVEGAKAVVAIGTCAAFGGLPQANPNPTGAMSVMDLVKDKPVINIPGCPAIPEATVGVITHFAIFGTLPELDELHRPKTFYGHTVHDRCLRRPFYEAGKFALSFDDEGAKQGWCLYKLGCKGPTTHNSCATIRWDSGLSFPIQSNHPCLGCSEPNFWDGGGFYEGQSTPLEIPTLGTVGIAAAAGLAIGAGMAAASKAKKEK